MNRAASLFVCCLLCLSCVAAVPAFQKEGGAGRSVQKSYPRHSELPLLDFKALKEGNVKQEQFNVEGYVASIYECPPCPKGAQCKPCFGDHIVVAETEGGVKSQDEQYERLLIFANSPAQFEKGKRYLFSVKLVGQKRPGERVGQVELIGYDAIKDANKH